MSFPKFTHSKDPDDILDYEIDWSARLTQGDMLVSSTFSVVQGSSTISRTDNTTMKTTVWLDGGTEGETVYVMNRVQTAGGRQMDQTVGIKIKTQ